MARPTACRVPVDERSSALRAHHKDPDAARAAVLRFDAGNPGRRREATKEWLAKNPEYKKTWKQRNPDRVRLYAKRSSLKAAYGITLEERDAMVVAQGGVCAVCGNPPGRKPLAVDHDHKTGVVRALLCGPCNTSLGLMKESVDRLRSLISYLEKHRAP